MRIAELGFENFRGFTEARLDIGDRETVVLAGTNGSGKSAVLQAAASLVAAVPRLLAGLNRPSFGMATGHNVRSSEVRAVWACTLTNGQERASLRTHEGELPSDWVDTGNPSGILFGWADALATPGPDPLTLPVLTFLHSSSTRQDDRLPVPPDAPIGRLSAYVGAFDQEAAHFDAFERWFEQEENLENQERISRGQLGWSLPSLRAVRRAVKTFLAELRAEHLGEMRVLRAHVAGPFSDVRGRLTVAKDKVPLFLDQLSDGERRLILLVGDVARRMSVLNPHLPDPLKSPGIVLVDEIDLHLHPGWQRRVMPAVRAAFPHVQLIVSTHSPQVLASVSSESVVLMKDFQFLPGHPKTWGRDTNTLLQTVFDVPERPEGVRDELARLYDQLEDHPDVAKKLYRSLKKKLEDDDPELARIETLLALAGA